MTGSQRGKIHRMHSEEFRAEAVQRATEPGAVVSQVAKELDLSPGLLARWVRYAKGNLLPSDYQKKNNNTGDGMKKESKKSRYYTDEFKAEAVRRALEPGAVIAHIAEEMDVSGYSVSAWVRAAEGNKRPSDYQKKSTSLAPANPAQSGGGVDRRDAEIARLNALVAKLTKERDHLKASLAHYLTEGQ